MDRHVSLGLWPPRTESLIDEDGFADNGEAEDESESDLEGTPNSKKGENKQQDDISAFVDWVWCI
ncbi:hypothetical protein K432DRAFT_43434 [Lepidopterella palustris CBS 459.81]|uniref:Uncharacterized protein n=1 Tax=Lepidopterella palustris CBS 459.81 TaxID=1314670 RepID=A0A8E2EAL3_9PEZI|nr:hypothetical protein K432DRAFT_43434 [Lepidopterella palustris CBS 459.81]